MKRVIYTSADGKTEVVNPNPNFVALFDSEDEGIAAVMAKDVPADATDVAIVDEIPDRLPIYALSVFRNAWKINAGKIEIDIQKARAIKTDLVREERNQRLGMLDNEMKIADDANNPSEQARVRAKRQNLRDLPATIQTDLDAITDPDALAAWRPKWPD